MYVICFRVVVYYWFVFIVTLFRYDLVVVNSVKLRRVTECFVYFGGKDIKISVVLFMSNCLQTRFTVSPA